MPGGSLGAAGGGIADGRLDRFSVLAPYSGVMKPFRHNPPAPAPVPNTGWWWRPSMEWARGGQA